MVKAPTNTRFLYDGDALVAEYDAAGALAARYDHGGNAADDPLVWYEGATTRWLHADHLGSVAAVTTGAGSSPTINSYDEYGIPGAGNLGRFQYTGQAWLPELGMYHYKARIYSPMLGRFMQTDPVGYKDQLNLYAYVANDPVNGRDPTGQCFENCPTGILFTPSQSIAAIGLTADFTLIIGDIKGIAEAVQNPTAINVIAAGVGLVPGIGDAVGKGLKVGSNIAENAAKRRAVPAVTPRPCALPVSGTTLSVTKPKRRKRAMAYFAGLDVSIDDTAICVVSDGGEVVLETSVATDPATIADALRPCAGRPRRGMSRHSLSSRQASAKQWKDSTSER